MQIHSQYLSADGLSPCSKYHADPPTSRSHNCRIAASSHLPQEFSIRQKAHRLNTESTPISQKPVSSWQERVMGLFEPALRDAEDLMLSLPYSDIREKTDSLATVLDEEKPPASASAASRQQWAPRRLSGANCPRGTSFLNSSESQLSHRMVPPLTAPNNHLSRSSLGQRCDSFTMTKAIYTCHESLIAIIVSYNQSLGHETEMAARRSLTTVLSEMGKMTI